MKEPKTDLYPQLEQGQVPVERLSAGSKTIIAICGAVAAFAIGWVTIRADISSNSKDTQALSLKLGEVEKGLNAKVDEIKTGLKAFDRLNDIQVELSNLKRNGSDNLQALSLRVDKLREDFRVHIARFHPKEPDPLP